jgi:hypothetical protein
MIDKVYDVKKMQLDQSLAKKQLLLNQIANYENEINEIQINLAQSGVKMFGSIADFKILAIHKNTMKEEQKKILERKKLLEKQVVQVQNQIAIFFQEIEQYKYILDMQRQEKIKKYQKYEELVASEYVQAKWINQ